ncbi:MAG: putative oxidoreductase YdhV [Chloroflexi bacterium]|nr:putative oxidoreductase YdhV [Chloroflexota bacterium]
MFNGGYLGRLLRIDLSTRKCSTEELDSEICRMFLGARGIAAYYHYREIPPGVDPLAEENKLMFFTGPVTGTPVPASTKLGLSTRSPETELYLCTNAGGWFGYRLKRAGWDGLIIEGRAEEPLWIEIVDEVVRLHDAKDLWGRTTGETDALIKEKSGNRDMSVLIMGPAAECGVRFSCIQTDGRSFGRGGGGLVMASKNLKAVSVMGSGEIPLAHPNELRDIVIEAAREARRTREGHTRFGTAQYTTIMSELGCYPTRNFQTSVFDKVQLISAEFMVEHNKVGNHACFRCPVACSQLCEVRSGEYAGKRSDPEFETIGAFGGQCAISDFDTIVAANWLCDELGIDTMSAGTIIAYAMECFEEGLFSQGDTGGIDLRFGNAQALLGMINKIARREDLGDLLAEGFKGIAKKRPDTVRFMMHVKGMSFGAYEPRGFHGIGLSYGTSSRGACHNVGGWTIRDELLKKTIDRFAIVGKGRLVKGIQDTRAYIDSLAICTVVRSALGFTDEPRGKILEAVTGVDLTPELMTIGERVYNLERLILVRDGIRRGDDLLPARISEEPLPEGPAMGKRLSREDYDRMLDEYYAARGWDESGVPTPGKLRELGLDSIGGN